MHMQKLAYALTSMDDSVAHLLPIFKIISRIFFATFILLFSSCSANSKKITESGEKLAIQNGTLAYMPKGSYSLADAEQVIKIEHSFFEDRDGNGTWTIVGQKTDCANVNGQWIHPKSIISGLILGRKYKSVCTLHYKEKNKIDIDSSFAERIFTY